MSAKTHDTASKEARKSTPAAEEVSGEPGFSLDALKGTEALTEKRPPGRRKGIPKVPGSGRKPGQVNKVTKDIKEMIIKRGKPAELLCDVVRGKKIRVGPQAGPGDPEYVYPTLQDRVSAARVLIGKVAPDMRSQELTGADGGPIETRTGDSSLNPMMELARRFAFVMASGEAAIAKPERLSDGSSPSKPKALSGTKGK